MARKAAGRLKKYDPTNTAVAIQPRICCVTALASTSSRNRGCRDHDPLGPGPLPILQDQAMRFKQCADLRSPQSKRLVQPRDQHAASIVTQAGGLGDARQLAIFG